MPKVEEFEREKPREEERPQAFGHPQASTSSELEGDLEA
jgi:hypothetical protein